MSFCQDFPGLGVEILLGKEVVPRESEFFKSIGYDNFYLHYDSTIGKVDEYKIPFPIANRSVYDSLVGKKFIVNKIYLSSESVNILDTTKLWVLELINDKMGTLYYKYNPIYDFNFELSVVGGLKFPEGFFCKEISKTVDKFTDEVTFESPTSHGISFIKVKNKGSIATYMSINVPGSTLNIGITGVIILLENGFKINKPNEKIDVDVSSGVNYVYSAFVKLNSNDIKLLSENKITDIRLYIYDEKVVESEKLKEYIKCIMKK